MSPHSHLQHFIPFGYDVTDTPNNPHTHSRGTCIFALKTLNPIPLEINSTSTTIIIHPPKSQPMIIMCIYIHHNHDNNNIRNINMDQIISTIGKIKADSILRSLPILIHGDFNSTPLQIHNHLIDKMKLIEQLGNWKLHNYDKPTHQRGPTEPSVIDNVITNVPLSTLLKTFLISPQQIHQRCNHHPLITNVKPATTPLPSPPPTNTQQHPCHDTIKSMISPQHHYLINLLKQQKIKRLCLQKYQTIASPQYWKQVLQHIIDIKSQQLQPQQKLDQIVSTLYEKMYNLLSTIIPEPSINRKKKPTAHDIMRTISIRERTYGKLVKMSNNSNIHLSSFLSTSAYHNFIRNSHNIMLHNYTKMSNDYLTHIIQVKTNLSNHLSQQSKAHEAERVIQQLNNIINNIENDPPPIFHHINDNNGILSTTEQQTIDNFQQQQQQFHNDQLQQAQQRRNDQQYRPYTEHASQSVPNSNRPPIHYDMLTKDFTEGEILQSIRSLKLFKSNGAVPFPQELLKCIPKRHDELKRTSKQPKHNDTDYSDPLLTIITIIMTMINQYEIQPTIFNSIFITFIHKPGNPTHLFSSYRPISIINNLMKLHNKLLCSRFLDYLLKQALIAWEQIGFLPKQSRHHHTITIAHIYTAFITNQQHHDLTTIDPYDPNNITVPDPNDNIARYILMLDFSKAFDTIDLDTLYDVLENEFNIPKTSKFTKLLQFIFANTKYYVKGPTTMSQMIHHHIGSMQGLPISPILFLCYINSLFITMRKFNDGFPWTLEKQTRILTRLNSLGFADDTNLISTNKQLLQQKATEALKWCYFRNMTVNPNKCAFQSMFDPDNDKNLIINHPFEQGKTITFPFQDQPTKYLGPMFSPQLDLHQMIKHDIKMYRNSHHNTQFLQHKAVPISIKRQRIYNIISHALRHCPIYALALSNTTTWQLITKEVNDLINIYVNAAWLQITERADFSTSQQVKYDALNIPKPHHIIVTSFTHIIDQIMNQSSLHQSPLTIYIKSINNPTKFLHIFQQQIPPPKPSLTKPYPPKPAPEKYCIISQTISYFIENLKCPTLSNPDLAVHNNLQYQLSQWSTKSTLSHMTTIKHQSKYTYFRDNFPSTNPQQPLHLYNPCGYHKIAQNIYTPIIDYAEQLPPWYLTIHNNYLNQEDYLPFKLMQHDINITTTPHSINNRNITSTKLSATGPIRNVMYNQDIITTSLNKNKILRVPMALSLNEQIVFNYCQSDKDISHLLKRHSHLSQHLYYLLQLRTRTFYTLTETSNRSNTRTSTTLPFRLPTTNSPIPQWPKPNTPQAQLVTTRQLTKFNPPRYNIMHYFPKLLQIFTKCQFCDTNRSIQHYILECNSNTICAARRAAFDTIQLRIKNDPSFKYLQPITDLPKFITTFKEKRNKYNKLMEELKRTTITNSPTLLSSWLNDLLISTNPNRLYNVIIDIQQLYGFDLNQYLLHNKTIPTWQSPEQIFQGSIYEKKQILSLFEGLFARRNPIYLPLDFINKTTTQIPQPHILTTTEIESTWKTISTTTKFLQIAKLALQIVNDHQLLHWNKNQFENWFNFITTPQFNNPFVSKIQHIFYHFIHNKNNTVRHLNLLWISLFLSEIKQL